MSSQALKFAFGQRNWHSADSTPSPLPPSRITSTPWETSRPRSTNDRRNGVSTCAFSVSVSTKPRKRFSPDSAF